MGKRTIIQKFERTLIAIASMLIKVYIKFMSPLITARCRFYPSCSHYFIKSMEVRGFLSGAAAGILRIIRCNPFCRGGYDPVRKK